MSIQISHSGLITSAAVGALLKAQSIITSLRLNGATLIDDKVLLAPTVPYMASLLCSRHVSICIVVCMYIYII